MDIENQKKQIIDFIDWLDSNSYPETQKRDFEFICIALKKIGIIINKDLKMPDCFDKNPDFCQLFKKIDNPDIFENLQKLPIGSIVKNDLLIEAKKDNDSWVSDYLAITKDRLLSNYNYWYNKLPIYTYIPIYETLINNNCEIEIKQNTELKNNLQSLNNIINNITPIINVKINEGKKMSEEKKVEVKITEEHKNIFAQCWDFIEKAILDIAVKNIIGSKKQEEVVQSSYDFIMDKIKLIPMPIGTKIIANYAESLILKAVLPSLVQKMYDLLRKEKVNI